MIIIYTTTKTQKDAKLISKKLLEKKLIACANIFPIESMYLWDNKINEENEYAVILKTRNELFEKVKNELKLIHKYETPAIISWNVDKADQKYVDWIKTETS